MRKRLALTMAATALLVPVSTAQADFQDLLDLLNLGFVGGCAKPAVDAELFGQHLEVAVPAQFVVIGNAPDCPI